MQDSRTATKKAKITVTRMMKEKVKMERMREIQLKRIKYQGEMMAVGRGKVKKQVKTKVKMEARKKRKMLTQVI